jgi:hypothetical protein
MVVPKTIFFCLGFLGDYLSPFHLPKFSKKLFFLFKIIAIFTLVGDD